MLLQIRSLVECVEIDRARHSHNCRGNSRHRIQQDDRRLKVRNGRSWQHYCLACAQTIIAKDIATLQGVADQIDQA